MQLYDYSTGGIEAHKDYNKKQKDKSKKLTKAQHRNIILAINSEIQNFLIETGKPYKLGHGLGVLQIRKKAPVFKPDENGILKARLPVDMGETMKLWREDPEAKAQKKKIYHRNLHTDGFTAPLKWENSRYMLLHDCWEFIPARVFNRTKAKTLKTVPKSIYRYLNVN